VLVDAHCHLADPAFDADRAAVLARARAAGVTTVVVVADGLDGSHAARRVARGHPGCVATAGLHPHRARELDPTTAGAIEALAREPDVVAVGETGLDYHYEHSPRAIQREAFAWHLALGARTGKPVVVHAREADADVAKLIGEAPAGTTGVMHSFAGSPDLLEAALARGFYVSFSGMVTFRSFDAHWALARVPDERLLVETDAPYLAPVPHRGKRNEPAFLPATAAALAARRGTTPERLAALTSANARRLFGLAPAPAPATP
jgi:TatD DNase family protein